MTKRFMITAVLLLLIASSIVNNLSEGSSVRHVTAGFSWPTSWMQIGTDPSEPGCSDHRDVVSTSYTLDSTYLYLRMETHTSPGWPSTSPTGEARHKWFIDTVGQDATIQGTSVLNAEFLLMLEDLVTNTNNIAPRDQLGELTFMDDLAHAGLTMRWNNPATSPRKYTTNSPNTSPSPSALWHRVYGTGTAGTGGPQGTTSDLSIGYRIDDTTTGGSFVDMYVSWAALGNPGKICLIWASDIDNPNIDQAPNCDRPTEDTCFDIPVINISVTKTLTTPAGGTANLGDPVVFTVTITNTGNTTLNIIPLTDIFDPSKLSYVSTTGPAPDFIHFHTATQAHLHWDDLTTTLGNLAPDGVISFTITFTAVGLTAPGSTVNNATVTDAEDTNGNHISDSDTASVITTAPPNIHIDKVLTTPSSGPANPSDTVVFTLTIENTGGTTFTVVKLVDTFDSTKLTFVSSTVNSVTTAPDSQTPAGTLTWNDLTGAGSLAPGSDINVVITFTVNVAAAPGPTVDTGTATGDPGSSQVVDDDSASVSISTPPPSPPTITVDKTLTTPAGGTAILGDPVVFTITITNTGPTDLVTVPFTDEFNPTKLSYVSTTAPTAPDFIHFHTATQAHLHWDDLTGVGNLASTNPDSSITFTITFTSVGVTAPGSTINTAEVNGAKDTNNNEVSGSDPASVIITAPPNIHVEKVLTAPSSGTAFVGDLVFFTITVENVGGTTFSTVKLVDTFDSTKLSFFSANPSPDSTAPAGTITWNDLTGAGSLAPGSDITVTITFTAIASTAPPNPTPDTNNVATVTANGVGDDDIDSVIIGFPPARTTGPNPVGGYVMPLDKSAMAAPYLALAGLIAAVSAVGVLKRRRERALKD